METAATRWQELVRRRAAQMDAAYARLGRTSADFWDRRARGFHRATRDSTTSDPLYLFLRARVTDQQSVLDVGAGTGRFTLALAPLVRHVTALEPNASMLGYLREEITARNLANVTLVQSTWEDARTDLHADVTICSHVLYPLLEIVPFLEKLHNATRQVSYLYLRANSLDSITAHLWQYFHGSERCQPPGYVHALDVLADLGIYANVEVVDAPITLSYLSPQHAEDELIEQLILEDTPETRAELRALLDDWLIKEVDGSWRSPVFAAVSAILWWRR